MSRKPLEGYRVFDFTGAKAGPFCTMMLADFGAEVIHVENPKRLDATRIMKPAWKNTSTEFFSLHRGKKNIFLDMKNPVCRDIAYDLIKGSDIFVENGKPGSAAKLGLGYEDVKNIKPDIIYASLSGFGQTGPYSSRAAYDTVIQAMSGFMSITGEEGGEPMKAGPSISDIVSGITAALGIAMAVIRRKETGEGTYMDVSMYQSLMTLCDVAINAYLTAGQVRHSTGNKHPANCIAEPVRCKDATFILQMFGNEQHVKFCEAFGMDDFTKDPRFCDGPHRVQNRDVLVHEIVEPVLANYTMEQVSAILSEYRLPFGQICTVDQVVAHPQFKARECTVEVTDSENGTFTLLGSPFKFNNFDMPKKTFCDQPGEHTKEVFMDLLHMSEEEADETIAKFV